MMTCAMMPLGLALGNGLINKKSSTMTAVSVVSFYIVIWILAYFFTCIVKREALASPQFTSSDRVVFWHLGVINVVFGMPTFSWIGFTQAVMAIGLIAIGLRRTLRGWEREYALTYEYPAIVEQAIRQNPIIEQWMTGIRAQLELEFPHQLVRLYEENPMSPAFPEFVTMLYRQVMELPGQWIPQAISKKIQGNTQP